MYGATIEQARPWIDNFEKRLNEIIGRLEKNFPGGCMIFLADIYDPSDGVGDAPSAWLPDWPDCMEILQAYNDVIYRCAEKHKSVHIVPMHDAFLGTASTARSRGGRISAPKIRITGTPETSKIPTSAATTPSAGCFCWKSLSRPTSSKRYESLILANSASAEASCCSIDFNSFGSSICFFAPANCCRRA